MASNKTVNANENNNNASDFFETSVMSPQRLLRLVSLAHWKQKIARALELHLHFDIYLTNKGNAVLKNPQKYWPSAYCAALAELVLLVSPQEANKLLSEKMARANNIAGVRTSMVRQVIAEVRSRATTNGITDSQNSTSTSQPHGGHSCSDP